jgi:hypothetical protein
MRSERPPRPSGARSMLDFAPDETVRRKIPVDNPARLFGFA